MTSPETKQAIVNEVRSRIDELGCTIPEKACLYWAKLTVKVLKEHGIRGVLQAGSLSWPIIRPEEDDGKCSTHFSYMWEPYTAITIQRIREDVLPEMHVWVGIPATGELVDITTRYLKQQCQETAGLPWRGDEPPDYLWDKAPQIPDKVFYEVDNKATLLAMHYAAKSDGVFFIRSTRVI